MGQPFICNKKQAIEKGSAGHENEKDSSCWQMLESIQQRTSNSSLENKGKFTKYVD